MDRISELPESIVTQILSYLPVKDSVKTSVLATRWKNHWLNVPILELNYSDFRDDQVFISFIDRVLEFNPDQSLLQYFKVISSSEEIEQLRDRIGAVVSRGIQHLDVKNSTYYREPNGDIYPCNEFAPLNLYTSKTLVSLKLSRVGLPETDFVSLPCLKFMSLRKTHWVGEMSLEKLLSGCPVLEELTLLRDLDSDIWDHHFKSTVRSRCLKKFCVPPRRKYFYSRIEEFVLEIDAPELEYMSIKEDHFHRIVVHNLTSLLKMDLDIKFVIDLVSFDPQDSSKKNEIRDFLTGIKSVRHMIISQATMTAFDLYSKVGLIPKFRNLSRLQAVSPSSSLQFLPKFLESCPNLKHLIWKIMYTKEYEAFEAINVPRCFLWTLECAEIEGLIYDLDWEEEEMKIASYFLEHSAVLKKLILRFAYPTYIRTGVSDSDIYEELNKLTKRSPRCQIVIDYDC